MRAWWIAAITASMLFAVGHADARGRTHASHHGHHRKKKSAPEPVKLPEPSPAETTPAPAPQASNDAPVTHHGPTRIDFDDRLIQGQTNKAGAVYLYDRKELQVRSMVHLRESFRQEIYEDAYGAR
jgi:hypothetical protein